MSDLGALRDALRDAAIGDDVDAIAAAAGRLTAALIARGHGRDEYERLLVELDARLGEHEPELYRIGVLLRLLRPLGRRAQLRVLTDVRRRLGIRWAELPASDE